MRLRYATDITAELAEHGMELLRQSHSFSSPLHSMGLRGLELVHADEDEQMDMLVDYVNLNKQRSIDAAVDKIRSKYGSGSIRRACLLGEPTAENIAFCSLPD